MVPLEMRLELAADAPIGVAEMIVDDRIGRLQIDRFLQFAHRVVIAPEPVIGPAKTVDDIAVALPQIDGAAQHLEGLVEIGPLIDP